MQRKSKKNEKTHTIPYLSFDEAAELAYFGAKILHPHCILPCKQENIPVLLKNAFQENEPGTYITQNTENKDIKAVAARDGITVIKIKSARMLMAYGFIKQVFQVFEDHQTAVDAISTSEVAISLTIDNDKKIKEIVHDLQIFAEVELAKEQCIICVVGNMIAEKKAIVKNIFNALEDIPIRMISYGGSNFNITLVVQASYKEAALNALNDKLFYTKSLYHEN